MAHASEAKFLLSARSAGQFPRPLDFEAAFFGRSNVGKSSLLNVYTGVNKLARVSSTPGCTREINFFLVDNKYYLVDLPGYGYARYSRDEQQRWSELIEEYITLRGKCILGVVILDIRRGLTDLDVMLLEILKAKSVNFIIVATKTDKLKTNELRAATMELKTQLKLAGFETEIIRFSATTGDGKKELYNGITKKFQQYREARKEKEESVFTDDDRH
jgi:GTP-binding protein